MRTMRGPGLFLAQFATDTPPHNTLAGIAKWAKDYGYKAIQIPPWDSRFFDLDRAYDSETYCDEIKGKLSDIGVAISEFSTHFQGQMVSVHPAYDAMFDGQCPAPVRGNPEKRRLWAAEQVRKAARVPRRFGPAARRRFTPPRYPRQGPSPPTNPPRCSGPRPAATSVPPPTPTRATSSNNAWI